MENFNNILNQQINTEKKLENLEPEEQNKEDEAEKKASIVKIEIGGVEMEGEKRFFEYPEHIQKETGILGYDRTIISEEKINNFLKEYSQNVNELESGQLLKSLVYKLSNGEYPNKCFTHSIGAYYGHKDGDLKKDKQKEFNENFVKSKFFIQKIYDIEYIKKQVDELDEKKEHYKKDEIFNSRGEGDSYYLKSNITIFNKETSKKVSVNDYDPMSIVGEKDCYDGIKSGKLFACTPHAGLNVECSNFFSWKQTIENSPVTFGFPMKDDSFYYKYLLKSLEVYANLLKDMKRGEIRNGRDMLDGVQEVLNELILSDPGVQKLKYEEVHGEGYIDNRIFPSTEYSRYAEELGNYSELFLNFEEAVNRVLKKIENLSNIKIDSLFNRKEIILGAADSNVPGGQHEFHLPIFIGLDDVPQLSWGHADYAHFTSSKGFNFIKFKHSDQLPTKEKDVIN